MIEAPITVILPSTIFTIVGNQFLAIASDCEKAAGTSILDHNGSEWYFHIRSHKTNRLAKFVVDREIRKDNKTTALQLVCDDHGGMVATIIND